MSPTSRIVITALLAAGLTACDTSDATAIRLDLAGDGSGTLTVTTLSAPDAAHGFESECSGVSFQDRARISHARGRVAKVDGARVSDIRFEHGPSSLRVRVPLGSDRRWPGVLAPTDGKAREQIGRAAGAGADSKLGTRVKLVVLVPKEVAVHGFHPDLRGVEASVTKDKDGWTCALIVPVDLVEEGRTLVWDMTWRD